LLMVRNSWMPPTGKLNGKFRQKQKSSRGECQFGGRDIALRCPRPRSRGRNESRSPPTQHFQHLTPCAAGRGADGAARRPYLIRTLFAGGAIGNFRSAEHCSARAKVHAGGAMLRAPFNPDSEVAGGRGVAEAAPECARPRAQPQASFQPQNRFQPLTHPALLRSGRPHSVNAEI